MRFRFLIATGLSYAMILTGLLPAMAQSSTQQGTSPDASQGGTSLKQHIVHDLEQQGYKNVQVMPASMVAQATDKQGRPVTMLITPDSITMVTAMNTPGSKPDDMAGGKAPSTSQ